MKNNQLKIKKILENSDLSGVCLVKQGDNVLYHDAHGYAHLGLKVKNNIQTRFDTASVTKLFTAVAILQLVDKGIIELEDRVLDILKIEDTTISRDVSLYQLLTHTSGIGDDADEDAGEDYEALFKENPNYKVRNTLDLLPQFMHKPRVFQPGEGCRYNNSAFVLLGLVIEKLTNISYREYVKKNIFEIAGMTSTEFCSMDRTNENVAEGYEALKDECNMTVGYRKNIYSYPPIGSPEAGAYTTALDLERFYRKLMAGDLLSKELTTDILKPKEEYEELPDFHIMMGYGFEFFVDLNGKIKCINKDGTNVGVDSILSYYPQSDITIVILANITIDVWSIETSIRALFD